MPTRTRPLTLWQSAALLVALLVCFALVLLADVVSGGALAAYGVQPRSATGLRGRLFAPFLHGNR